MRLISLVRVSTAAVALWAAAGKWQSLRIKVGLWEVTTTVAQQKITIPAALLEKLTPDQRARIRARMDAQKSNSRRMSVTKECVTDQQLAHGIPFLPTRERCTWTVLSSDGVHLNARTECAKQKSKSVQTIQIEALGSESVIGSIQQPNNDEKLTNPISTFSAKWIRAPCGTN